MKTKLILFISLLGSLQVTKPEIDLKDAVLLSCAVGGFAGKYWLSNIAKSMKCSTTRQLEQCKTYRRFGNFCAALGVISTLASTGTILDLLGLKEEAREAYFWLLNKI